MNAPSDDMFRDAHSVFQRNHEDLREAMLSSLPSTPPVKSRPRFRRILTGLAAALLIGLGITAFFTTRTAPAYGLEGLRERLLMLRSLYLKGWMFQQKKTDSGPSTVRLPVQRYFERPGRYYSDNYGFTLDEKGFLSQMTSYSMANDGQRAMSILHDQKLAVLAPGDPLDAQLYVETHLQFIELDEMLGGHAADFERIGSERLGSDQCDVYQSKPSRRPGQSSRRIWINRANGLPVRFIVTAQDANGAETPAVEFSEIRANVDPPAELFSFKAPAGFTLTEVKEVPTAHEISPFASSAGRNQQSAVWLALRIDDRAVLLCWSHAKQERNKKTWFPGAPQFLLRGVSDRGCSEHKLFEAVSGDYRWRWSLLLPNDRRPIGFDWIAVAFLPSKNESRIETQPLVFPQDRLAEILENVQRRSLEASGDFSPMKSLEQLREMIADDSETGIQQRN
jgi:hypothetical protein